MIKEKKKLLNESNIFVFISNSEFNKKVQKIRKKNRIKSSPI